VSEDVPGDRSRLPLRGVIFSARPRGKGNDNPEEVEIMRVWRSEEANSVQVKTTNGSHPGEL